MNFLRVLVVVGSTICIGVKSPRAADGRPAPNLSISEYALRYSEALSRIRETPHRSLTETEILAILAQPHPPRSAPWHGWIHELGRVGGQEALDYLHREKARVGDDKRGTIDYAITVIHYRQTPDSDKERFVLDILGDRHHPAFGWAVEEAGELGIKAALPLLDVLIKDMSRGGHDAPVRLIRQKIVALTRYGRPLAYFMASKCMGEDENKWIHLICAFKIWGYTKLGTMKDPGIAKYLRTALQATANEFDENWRQRSLTAGLVKIEDKSYLIAYYDAIYEALRQLGVDPGPRHKEMIIDY